MAALSCDMLGLALNSPVEFIQRDIPETIAYLELNEAMRGSQWSEKTGYRNSWISQ